MNAVAQSLTGWSLAEAQGNPITNTLHLLEEQTRKPANNPVTDVLNRGMAVLPSRHKVLIARDGTEKPVEDSASPIRDDQGQLQGVVLVLHDLTERRRAEGAVREAERLARVTLDALPANICVLDEAGQVVAVNRSWRYFARAAGATLMDDGVGLSYIDVCDNASRNGCEDAAAFANGIRRVLSGMLDSFTLEYALPDYSKPPEARTEGRYEKWYMARVARFSGITLRGVVIAHEDVSPLKQAEAELKALNETLEQRVAERTAEVVKTHLALHQAERLAAIGQMMTALSHESRNALQRSHSCLEMLGRRFQQTPDVLHLIQEAQRAQDDLQRVHEEVRAYAAPIKLDLSYEYLPALWRDSWEHVSHVWEGRQAELVEELKDSECRIHIDAFRFRQVFRNLFENSLAACADPVVIRVTSRIDELNGQKALRLSIHDNGPGAKAEDAAHIFEPFYTTKSHGTGLGMAIVKRIVESHEGKIEVYTAPGAGFEVIVWLPQLPAPEPPQGLRDLGLLS